FGKSHIRRLKGKFAIITGGASGFGKTTTKLFVQHGAKVVIGDVQDEQGLSLCNEINNNDHVTYVHCNVSDDNDVKSLIDHTISKHGKLDIMFNNAGIWGDFDTSILTSTDENFKSVFETNVYGCFLGAKHAARVMIPAKTGVILFTANIASMICIESPHAYTMSKHAIIGLMKSLSLEMGQYGIRVNAISPGAVSTPLSMNTLGMDKEKIDEIIGESYVLKGVTPEPLDVANAALFLASDEAKFVRGANFVDDGGYFITNPSFSMALNNKHFV
ncbi:secoisolariciresinol dehydrogenase-like, partial [Chenopodium quinoa]|uniref:secoisolariciresinol dehydrogenase-like n=1 Tax=Chenopodium quinoa TaxID=63459 RepID=UPI000B799B78